MNDFVEYVGATPVDCLFVGNLSIRTSKQHLISVFEQYGLISAEIRHDQQFIPFGFVKFPTAEHAGAAMQALNGSVLNGRKLK